MCTPGVGCYTTPAEAAAAQSGNYNGYYQLACAGGDATACFDQHIAANDNVWGLLATNRLLNKLRQKAQAARQCLNEAGILNQIRIDLAQDYANSQGRWYADSVRLMQLAHSSREDEHVKVSLT